MRMPASVLGALAKLALVPMLAQVDIGKGES